MKITHTCLAIVAAAGLTMFTGCGDMSEPEVSQNEIETPNEVTAEQPGDIQYGSPEREGRATFEADLEEGDNSFITPENQNQSTFEGNLEEGEAEFVTPDGEEGEVEIEDGEAEIDM